MKIIIIPKHTQRGFRVEVQSEHSSFDSYITNLIGESILETVCDFFNFEKDRQKGNWIVVLPNRQNIKDWIANSNNRDSAKESKEALQFVIDNIKKANTKNEKKVIIDRCRHALNRVSW